MRATQTKTLLYYLFGAQKTCCTIKGTFHNFRKRERTKDGGASNATDDTAHSDSADYEDVDDSDETDDDCASNASSSAASEAKQKKTKKPAALPTVCHCAFILVGFRLDMSV